MSHVDQLREANDRYVRALEEQSRLATAEIERQRAECDRLLREHGFAQTLAQIDPLRRSAADWRERAAHTDDPVEYLGRRLKEVVLRVAWANDLEGAQRRGIDRFAPGLDSDLDVVREEIRRVGGLTNDHLRELGRLPAKEEG